MERGFACFHLGEEALPSTQLPVRACAGGSFDLTQARIAAMVGGWWINAMRCIREAQFGQAITSTANTLRSSVAHGIQRRRMVLPLLVCSYAMLCPAFLGVHQSP